MVDRDLSLWRSWRERSDGDAFGSLVRPHVEFATRLARRTGLAAADADDVVQRSLIRLAAESTDRPAHVGLRAWLGRSVVNETRMFFRARRRRAEHEASAPLRADAASDPVEARDEVERALSELDESSRRIVELRYFHDLEYREIAFIEGGTALGARLRVHRALGRLRGRLGRGAALSIATLAAAPSGPSSADAAVARCIEAVDAGGATGLGPSAASVMGGGLIVGTTAKVGVCALAAALVATGLILIRRDAPAPVVPRTATVTVPAPVGEPAPPALAAPASPRPAPPQFVAAAVPVAGIPIVAVPLDAPIPAGKGSVAGVVKFKDGTPFAHAKVALWGTPRIEAETDDEGRFHIHGEWVGHRDLTLLGSDGSVLGLASVAMKTDTRVTVDVVLERGVSLSGTVREAVTLAPIAAANVKLRRPGAHSENSMQGGFGFATSDAAGRFRFEHVPSAPYTLEVAAAGHEADGREFSVAGEDQSIDVALKVARALIIRLTNAPALAIGATIPWMIQSDGDAPASSRISLHGKAVLVAPGEIRLDSPPPGAYQLTLFESKVLPRLETALDVTEASMPEVTMAVPAGASVDGTLLGRDGKAMSGVPIRVGESPIVRTDAAGRFRVEQAAAGRQPIWLGAGLGTLSIRVGSVDVAASGVTAVAVTLPGTASIAFTMKRPDADGVAVLTSDDGTKVATAWPDEQRRVRIEHLAFGRFVLEIVASDAAPFERRIELFEGQAFDLGDVELELLPVVPVHVTFPPGVERPKQVTVFAQFGTPMITGRIEFDGEGRGWLKGLPAGEYHLTFQWTKSANAAELPTADVVVKAGITVPIQIDLRAK